MPPVPRAEPRPIEKTVLDDIKDCLSEDPENESLKDEFRQADLEYRSRTWMINRFIFAGTRLLIAAGLLLVLSVFATAALGRRAPQPVGDPDAYGADRRRSNRATLAVAGFMGVTILGAIGAALGLWWAERPVPRPPEPQIDVHWPRFRGPGGSGVTDMEVSLDGISMDFDQNAPENGWKTRVPLAGRSSTVLSGNHLFVTGADKQTRKVFAFSAATGRLMWEAAMEPRPVKEGEEPLEVPRDTGYAASTPCTDGSRVYAIFADGTLAGVDFSGKTAWTRHLGLPDNTYGHATSLLMSGEKLIVLFDQRFRDTDGGEEIPRSRLMALSGETGETIWQTVRNVRDSWATPIVINTPAGPRIITVAEPWAAAYDPVDGKEVWRAKVLGGDVAPSPAYSDGTVFVAMDGSGTTAIRTGGRGDVTKTHIAWHNDKSAEPDAVSPLVTGGRLLTVSGGILTCFDKKTGRELWKHSFEKRAFNTSPTLVGGGRVLMIDTKGRMYLIEAGDKFRLLEQLDLGQECDASPAFGAGRIFIRARRHLFCLRAAVAEEGK
jgi:outer membrane protein assembly factor BamB